MTDPNHYFSHVALAPGGDVVGWIGAYVFRSIETPSCAEVSGLVVDEGVRSRGVGKLLIEAAERWARDAGCRAMSVRSNILRRRAHRFYRTRGYHYVKTQKQFLKAL